jgi:PAS domain S-box-containing protein
MEMPRCQILPRLLACFLAGFAVLLADAAELQWEDYLVDVWQTEQGLPENSATAMAQSPEGYLWFGTYNGLVRFDGIKFESFEPRNTPELPSHSIINLHLDAKQQLWISTERGLVRYTNGTWETCPTNSNGWTGAKVRTFSEQAGTLCLTGFEGEIFQVVDKQITRLPDPEPHSPQKRGWFGHVDKSGAIWVARENLCAVWRTNQWVVPDWAARASAGLQCAGTGRDGSLLLVSSNAIHRISQGAIQSTLRLSRNVGEAWQILEDSRGSFWVTSYQRGLHHIRADGTVRLLTTSHGLSHDALRFAFEDRENNLWIGSSGGGLMRLKERSFRTWGKDQGLPERNVKAIAEEAPGRILLGTYGGGLARLENNSLSRVLDHEGRGLPSYVQCLLIDRQGRTWLGSDKGGLRVREGDRWANIATHRFSGASSIRAIFEDGTGRVWVGDQFGLVSFPTNSPLRDPVPAPPVEGAVRLLAEDPITHELLAATSDGLFRFTTSKWTEVRGPKETPLLEISCLRFETNGNLWVGGGQSGLARRKDNRWSKLGEENGLASHDVASITEDGEGHWWIGSNRGLTRVAFTKLNEVADLVSRGSNAVLNAAVFDRSEGLASLECTAGFQNSTLRDSRGHLWFSTPKGASLLDPAHFPPTPQRPLLVLLRTPQPGVPPKKNSPSTASSREIRLKDGTRVIHLEWTAISFTAPEKIRFAYRLFVDDEERPWIDLKNSRSLALQLPQGSNFRFELRAANNGSKWTQADETLPISVEPYVWETNWFIASLSLIVLVITAIAVWQAGRSRLKASVDRTLLEQKEIEEQLIAGQEQIRRVLDTLPAAAYACDPLGQLTYFNRHAALLWGRVPRMGHTDDRFCGSLRLLSLDGATIPHDQCWTAHALSQQRSTTAEVVIERPGGRRRIVQAHANPLIDSSGRLIGAVSVLMDITEDKNARETLAANEALLRQLIQHTPAAVAMFDLEMRYIQASDRWSTDYHLDGQSIIGRNHYDVFPDTPKRWKEAHRRALAGSVERAEEDLYERADGSREWIQWEVRPWRKAGGIIGGVVIFTQLVTARRAAEQRIRDQLDELQRWHRATLGREDRVQQLKREVNDLARRLGLPLPYSSQTTDNGNQANGTGNQPPTPPRS